MEAINYGKLRGRMAEESITQKELSQKIGISESQLSGKLSSNYSFKQSEIVAICNALGIDYAEIPTYFFTLK